MGFFEHPLHDPFLGLPNFKGIVLYPARLRKMLRELLLVRGHGLAFAIEQHRPGTGGALVECKDVSHGH